jgi:hypothetical protein
MVKVGTHTSNKKDIVHVDGVVATDYGHIVTNGVTGYEQPIDNVKPMSDVEYWKLQTVCERIKNEKLVAALKEFVTCHANGGFVEVDESVMKLARNALAAAGETCTWTLLSIDADGSKTYETSCHRQYGTFGNPADDNCGVCCYCGKALAAAGAT